MRRISRAVPLLLLLTLVPGGTGAAEAANPMKRGPFAVENVRYNAGLTTVRDPNGVTFAERLQGSLHIPQGKGPFPLLIFLHGRHGTCEFAERLESFGFPCPDAPPAVRDVPSYLGYEYLADHLASHGFVVDSISANGINSYDIALLLSDNGMNMRAEIVARQLDLLAGWNESGSEDIGNALVGKIDLDRIGLMGHSRGGEGVARFVAYNRERSDGPTYDGLRAVFALAPTDFYGQKASGVHFGTLLPLCDGDVYNLQGAWMYDRARFLEPPKFARVQFTVNGANHNFFNTVWTFDDGPGGGDDSGNNPACDPDSTIGTRLTAKEQRRIGLGLMSAFFLRYVGEDERYDPYMTGARSLPESTCPAFERVIPEFRLACGDVIGTSYLGPRSTYEMLIRPTHRATFSTSGKVDIAHCVSAENGTGCPTVPTRAIAEQLTVSWSGRGEIRIPVGDDVSDLGALSLRGGLNFRDPLNRAVREQDLHVALIDDSGRESVVRTAPLGNAFVHPAGPSNQQLTLNGMRIPLSLFAGVDLNDLDRIELRFGDATRTGSIQLLEVAFQKN